MIAFTEAIFEEAALEWFGAPDSQVLAGPTTGQGEEPVEHASHLADALTEAPVEAT